MSSVFALFQPQAGEQIQTALELDAGRIRRLADGSLLVPSPLRDLRADTARTWLDGLGGWEQHDDPRGVLVFVWTSEVETSTTYAELVEHLGDRSLWLSPRAALNTLATHAATDLSCIEMNDHDASQLLKDALDKVVREMLTSELRRPTDAEDLVIAVKRTTPLPLVLLREDPGSSAHESLVLADGTLLIRSIFHRAASEELGLLLAEWHTEWVEEHDDPRGVPTFAAKHLDQVRDADSYATVLARVAGDVAFIIPRTLREVGVTIPVEKLRSIFEG